jgi:transcriptional regulator with XRE-family HTH domain
MPEEGAKAAAQIAGDDVKRYRQRPGPSGAELRAARKAGGLSQTALGAKAGISRHAVSYWECRTAVDPKGWAVQRMAEAEPQIRALLQTWETNTRGRGMGLTLKRVLPVYARSNARARDGSYSPRPLDALLEAAISHELSRMKEKEAQRRARLRVTCGAKTTRKGTPCRNKSEPGRKRCKFHGGRSTGPRTPEGKARIAEAQRARWARWRAALAQE